MFKWSLAYLLLLIGETVSPASAICSDEARADVRTTGFWGRCQGRQRQPEAVFQLFPVTQITHNVPV